MARVLGDQVCPQPIDNEKGENVPGLPAAVDGVPQGCGALCRDFGQAPRERGGRR